MKLKLARIAQVAAILAAAVALASPALVSAEPHGFGGGGHAHFSGGRVGGHAYAGRGYAGRGNVGHAYVGRGYAGHAYVGRGYAFGARAGYHPYWGGGWWGGYYWPRAYYGWDYPWFLAALPLGFLTYWWDGIPYYYANDIYYSWSPDDSGYVVTNPPPVADQNGSDSSWYSDPQAPGPQAAGPSSNPSAPSAPAAAGAPRGPDDVYMYPEHGQSAQQQSTDRYECHTWAQQQSGFDPTQSASASSGGGAEGYHRALVACLTGRGYSVD